MSKKKVAAKAKPKPVIDPAIGPQLVLRGQIVTMDGSRPSLGTGCSTLTKAVLLRSPRTADPCHRALKVLRSPIRGHDLSRSHRIAQPLSYDFCACGLSPEAYSNRGQWAGFRNTGQHQRSDESFGRRPDLLASLARYVECKCLLGGTTTSQGIELFSNAGARRFYRGIVRNVDRRTIPTCLKPAPAFPTLTPTMPNPFWRALARRMLSPASGRRAGYDSTQTFPQLAINPASGRSLRHWREFTVLRCSRKTST